MKLYTIGFTKKSAERFFSLLREAGVTRLIDIRLHPAGQLAGFTKQEDLRFFLRELASCDYYHLPELAPSPEILAAYRASRDWHTYRTQFELLMDERGVPSTLDRAVFEERICCVLCSEATPEQCHRRLVADRLAKHWPGTEVIHLL